MKNISKCLTVGSIVLANTSVYSTGVHAFELDIYGVGHVSMDNVDNGESASLYATSNSSRLGLKGEQIIDDNLTLIFQLESGLDPTSQGTNDGNGGANSEGQIFTKGRPSFIGVKGDWGTALVGHMPALDQWANDYNLFADKIGDLGNFWEGSGISGISGIPGRLDNVVYYQTPTLSNFDLAITYSPEEGLDGTSKLIAKGNYAANNLKMGIAIANIGQGSGLEDHQAHAITAQYDFGNFSVGGGYQTENNIGGTNGTDRDNVSIGSKVQITKRGSASVQYAVTSSDAADTDAKLFAIGYDFALNENTTVYGAYATLVNQRNVQFSVNGKGHGDKVTPGLGQDPSAISFGIIYNFDSPLARQ